jgi:hypothetical protein
MNTHEIKELLAKWNRQAIYRFFLWRLYRVNRQPLLAFDGTTDD